MKRVFGIVLIAAGCLLALSSVPALLRSLTHRILLGHVISLSIPILLGIALVLIGAKLATSVPVIATDTARRGSMPSLPPGFKADFWHKNIALSSTAGTLWLRDKDGRTGVFQKGEIIGWEMLNSNFSSQAAIGPRITPMDNRLVIKTRNLEKPVWTVPFDSHGSLTGRANHRNHEEMKAWFERLNIVYNHAK